MIRYSRAQLTEAAATRDPHAALVAEHVGHAYAALDRIEARRDAHGRLSEADEIGRGIWNDALPGMLAYLGLPSP